MTSDSYSITIRNAFQGAALPFSVTFWDVPPDPTQTPPVVGVPHDISLWHFMFTMKKDLEDADTVPPAVYIHDWLVAAGAGTSGVATWTVPAATINSIEAKFVYYWDLRALIPPSTDPAELIAGTVYLNPSVGQRLAPVS
jgi:hypothetical protein